MFGLINSLDHGCIKRGNKRAFSPSGNFKGAIHFVEIEVIKILWTVSSAGAKLLCGIWKCVPLKELKANIRKRIFLSKYFQKKINIIMLWNYKLLRFTQSKRYYVTRNIYWKTLLMINNNVSTYITFI